MRPCPFCAEEIREAAIRCKHCRSDLLPVAPSTWGAAERRSPRRNGRRLVAGAIALLALLAATPVLGRTLSRVLRTSACEPSSWGEWHTAFRNRCVEPSYVCKHMTTPKLLDDPELVQALGPHGSGVADVVGRMRDAYGCTPERAPAFRPGQPEPGPFAPPAFPPQPETPRAI